jgi:hypothetical protein
MFFNSSGFMKKNDPAQFRFLLALAGGQVLTLPNNQQNGEL